MTFCCVETIAVMNNGRVIHRIVSDPKGISHTEYEQIDTDMVTAFPKANISTIGTPI